MPPQVLAQEGLLPAPTHALSESESDDEEGEEGGEGGGGEAVPVEAEKEKEEEEEEEEEEEAEAEEAEEEEAEEEEEEEWLDSGHELVGQRVARVFPTKRGHEERVVLGTVSKWLREDAEAGDEARHLLPTI